jgi:hypothetical protein
MEDGHRPTIPITQSIKWINLDYPFIPSPLRERVRVRVRVKS